MKRLVLHIGSAKCGSSSIQGYLSDHFTQDPPRVNINGETVAYAAIWGHRVLLGSDLEHAQRNSLTGYVSSASLLKMEPGSLAEKLKLLKELTSDLDIVILSCEAWALEFYKEDVRLFWDLGVPVDLVYIIRPPVELMNSAWWQWGVWTGLPVEGWCGQHLGLVDFMTTLRSWRGLGPLARVKIIELSQDPIRQFMQFLDIDAGCLPRARNLNVGTNSQLLRHLIRSKSRYGREVHKPGIEFQLNRILRLSGDKPPSVISPSFARSILERVHESSSSILGEIARQGEAVSSAASEKYLNTSYYDLGDEFNFEDWISQEHSDDFIHDLVANLLTVEKSRSEVDQQLQRVLHELDEVTSTRLWRLRTMLLGATEAAKRFFSRPVASD